MYRTHAGFEAMKFAMAALVAAERAGHRGTTDGSGSSSESPFALGNDTGRSARALLLFTALGTRPGAPLGWFETVFTHPGDSERAEARLAADEEVEAVSKADMDALKGAHAAAAAKDKARAGCLWFFFEFFQFSEFETHRSAGALRAAALRRPRLRRGGDPPAGVQNLRPLPLRVVLQRSAPNSRLAGGPPGGVRGEAGEDNAAAVKFCGCRSEKDLGWERIKHGHNVKCLKNNMNKMRISPADAAEGYSAGWDQTKHRPLALDSTCKSANIACARVPWLSISSPAARPPRAPWWVAPPCAPAARGPASHPPPAARSAPGDSATHGV